MATVNLTGRIKDGIRNQVKAKFEARRIPLRTQVESWGLEFYNALVEDELQKNLAKIPDDFLHTGDSLSLNMGGYGFTMALGKDYPIKAGWGRYGYNAPKCPAGPLYDKVSEVVKLLAAIDEEQKTLLASLDRTMESCPNVKRLLEVWPTAINYLDAETLERHNKVQEKYAPAVVVPLDEDGKRLLAKTALLS